ncbi:MAG: S-adenosylmethionine:tRNA ribosyltransferase-isomerase, partial [Solirubrobacteraceae bacterium]
MTALAFELRPALEAHEPPEARGVARDEVRLLVARRGERSISHHSFSELPELLEPGDVVVINISATIPAALPATASDGTAVRVHFATRAPQLDDDWRVVEIRSADGTTPHRLGAGERLELRGGAALDLIAPYASGQRLMLARFCCALLVDEYLESNGEPIRYSHVSEPWPLEAYQNVYAVSPGSAEMPSAGRPITRELISRLVAREIAVVPITLHCGVSSPESHEPPFPEWYEVPERTVERIAEARRRG